MYACACICYLITDIHERAYHHIIALGGQAWLILIGFLQN